MEDSNSKPKKKIPNVNGKPKKDFTYLLTNSIPLTIPNDCQEKQSFLCKLKLSLIDIKILIAQLSEKRSTYEEAIASIEEDMRKETEAHKTATKLIEMTLLQENTHLIDNYEDFNDLDNCQGCIEYNGVEEEPHHPSLLHEVNRSLTQLEEVKEEEEEGLADKYALLKKPKAKTKVNKKGSSQSLRVGHEELSDACSFPKVESLDEEKLKDQCKVYGLKPGTRNAMKKQLKDIYSFLSTKQLPEKMKKELTSFLSNNEEPLKDKSFNVKETLGSKAMSKVFTEAKKKLIIDTIKEDKSLWEKVLLFKKIDLKDVKSTLLKAKLFIENTQLKEFLLSLGAVFGGGWNND